MMDEVILCADTESLMHPEMIGLDGCRLDAVPWLKVFSSGEETRAHARKGQGGEVWVASADDMEAINVAAALKHDDPLRTVCLVAADATGSVSSRAHAARVDQMFTLAGFVHRFYAEHQRQQAQNNSAASGAVKESSSRANDMASVAMGHAPLPYENDMTMKLPQVSVSQPSIASAVPSALASAHPAHAATASIVPPTAPLAVPSAIPVSTASAIGPRAGAKNAFLLPVVSGSGGAGKTTVSLYLSLLARSEGYRTLLVDGDLQFGELCSLLNLTKAPTMAEVLQSSNPLALLCGTDTLPAVIAAPRKLEEAELYAREMPQMLDALAPHFDVIIVNTGNSWTEYHAPLLERASCTLFLIDQRVSSVRAAQHALDVCMRSGIATSSFLFALNRCVRNAFFTSMDVSCALNGAHVVELKDGGDDVEELCGAGLGLDLLHEKNDFCESVEELLSLILPSKGQQMGRMTRSRARGRAKDGRMRGERRSTRRGKHGKRESAMALEATNLNASPSAMR